MPVSPLSTAEAPRATMPPSRKAGRRSARSPSPSRRAGSASRSRCHEAATQGVAADVSHMNSPALLQMKSLMGDDQAVETLEGAADMVIILAGFPRKTGMPRDELCKISRHCTLQRHGQAPTHRKQQSRATEMRGFGCANEMEMSDFLMVLNARQDLN